MEGGAVIETRLGLPDRKQINTGKQLATGSCLDRPVPVPDQSSLGKSSSSPVPSAAVRITGHFGCLIVCVCVCVLSAVLWLLAFVALGFLVALVTSLTILSCSLNFLQCSNLVEARALDACSALAGDRERCGRMEQGGGRGS